MMVIDEEAKQLAKELWLQGEKYKKISEITGIKESSIKSLVARSWKKEKLQPMKDKVATKVANGNSQKRKRGGQPGNKNATGPPKNQHARKHGLFSKWLPEEINEIIGEMPDDQLDILWHNIQLQYANIIHSQKILYVRDKDDKTKELTFNGEKGEGYEVQYAWDKQAGNMSALSRSMKTLMSMIKEYDELLHKNWDTASEIQKAQLAQIQAQTQKLQREKDNESVDAQVVINDDIPKQN